MTEATINCGKMDKPAKWETLAPVNWNSRIQSCPDCDTKRIGHCKNPECAKTDK